MRSGVGRGFQYQRVGAGRDTEAIIKPGVAGIKDLYPVEDLHESQDTGRRGCGGFHGDDPIYGLTIGQAAHNHVGQDGWWSTALVNLVYVHVYGGLKRTLAIIGLYRDTMPADGHGQRGRG